MTTVSKAPASVLPDSGGEQPGSTVQEDWALRWTVIVPVVLIAAVVLLVGLPLGAVWIMNSSGCCLAMANSPENVITFWASMTAAFLTLFAMIITGVFIITSFRVDATARATARVEAQNEVWTYIEHYRNKLYNDLRALESLVEEVKERGEYAKQAFAKAEEEVEARQKEASNAIDDTTNAARQAQEAIAGVLNETTNAANETQATISQAGQEVQRQRDETIRAMDGARQEAEAAARELRERADRAAEGPTQTEGDAPEQPDE